MSKSKHHQAVEELDSEPILEAQIEQVRPNVDRSDAYVVRARCPYCKGLHQHGIYSLTDEPGTRVPDCNMWSPSYRLVLPS